MNFISGLLHDPMVQGAAMAFALVLAPKLWASLKVKLTAFAAKTPSKLDDEVVAAIEAMVDAKLASATTPATTPTLGQ